jgi:hypothetical protein
MKGKVVYFFAFDVAQEIRTSEVGTVLSEKAQPWQIQLGPAAPKDLPFGLPPAVAPPAVKSSSSVGPITLKRVIKVFDVGVLSISMEIEFEVSEPAALIPYHQISVDGVPLQQKAEELCRKATEGLKPLMVKPTAQILPPEAYTVFCLETVEGDPSRPVAEWVQARRQELAQLLGEEPSGPPLAPAQVSEMFRVAQSYTVADHTVIDWDAALVIDRSGYFEDVLYVIELANLQLEEFQLLDHLLDKFFLRAYDDLDRYFARPRIFRGPRKIMKALRSIRMDVTKMTEEVTNITKFVGDWYLARVYLGCKDRFHLAHWEASVDQKLNQLDELYSIANAEINNWRMLLLEGLIVALFLLDLAALFFLRPG